MIGSEMAWVVGTIPWEWNFFFLGGIRIFTASLAKLWTGLNSLQNNVLFFNFISVKLQCEVFPAYPWKYIVNIWNIVVFFTLLSMCCV